MDTKENIPVKEWIEEYFSKKEYLIPTTLCAIMTSYGSDKGEGRHNYTTLYSKLFSPWKNEKIYVFELGIGTNNEEILSNMGAEGKPGASLYGWSLFFPEAQIYGADIDKRILFEDTNIQTFYCDQMNKKSIQELFQNESLKDIYFDIMIEDGLHTFEANLNFLLSSIHKLKKGGFFIVEDLSAAARVAFINHIPALKKNLDLTYLEVLLIPSKYNRFDNALLLIQK